MGVNLNSAPLNFGILKVGVLALLLTSVACTQGHCRRKTDAAAVNTSIETPAPAEPSKVSEDTKSGRVFVYKYDGSLQCKMGKAIAPEVMAKELQGVPVFSSIKKPDGLMHIQVCGSITGMANVFEINAENLKKAEARGFKKWSFE